MNYTVGNNEKLRNLCIKENWFTYGSNRQYDKLFYANKNQFPLEEIVTIIWLCSNDERENIKQKLIEFNNDNDYRELMTDMMLYEED